VKPISQWWVSFHANSQASRMAEIIDDGSARFFPAMAKAVP
jgi:hypothetical protein